jgi:heterogeneous nuclear ribonucleoprotein K
VDCKLFVILIRPSAYDPIFVDASRGGRGGAGGRGGFNGANRGYNGGGFQGGDDRGGFGGYSRQGGGGGDSNMGHHQLMGNPNQYSQQNASMATNQVTIPNELAGTIIGPRGSKISQIREQSGAGITIDKPVPGTNDRIITITGTQEQIQNAQYLLQMT